MKYLKRKYILFESEIDDIIEKCRYYNIKKYEIDDDGLLTVYENVNMISLINTNKIPFKFKEVFGGFNVSYTKIETLEGSPIIVHGDFDFRNTNVKNLKYCPQEINGSFFGSFNYKLKHFIEFPKFIKNNIDFSRCGLKSLYVCNDYVYNSFNISDNIFLKSLKYGPRHVDGSYWCFYCNLKLLYGSPKYVGRHFYCSNNKLTSLKYSPRHIGGDFNFGYNNIKSFDYFPDHVGGEINCKSNPIYNVWKLFEDIDNIYFFNKMKIIKDDKINIKRLNLFLISMGKEPVKSVEGYINI